MTVGLLTEKRSAARNFAKALGGERGTWQGEPYVITHAHGHLLELKKPVDQVDSALRDRYGSWQPRDMPWDLADIAWERELKKDAAPLLRTIAQVLGPCDEIVIATDVDPTGEGELLAWEIISELGLDKGRRVSRMIFTDEAPASIQKAFTSRVPISSMMDDDDYRKAELRSRFDWLLGLQYTRISSFLAGEPRRVVRQGRLKSAMVLLVGDQEKARAGWKKVPFFENRFRDEVGVVYSNPDEPRFPDKNQVPSVYSPSAVVRDSVTTRHQAPPRMLDLAGLSALLATRGFSPGDVLSTYQRMYEAQVVSYPRTEDKHVTSLQFAELVANARAIASAVGVDPGLLTHTAPRRSHVKDSGAHGANRPGPRVPSSLDDVRRVYGELGAAIYELVARSALAVLAEDYVYDQHKGHVADYPDFTGSVSVPRSPGWKQVLGRASLDDEDESTSTSGLGTRAEPFVHEGFPPKPAAPTMKWLVKQLEKRDVGTGATRTSTLAEVTSSKAKYPLMTERRGTLGLAETGTVSYMLLPGTYIGDLSVTEHVHADMRAVAAGTKTWDDVLAGVADLIRHDITIMTANAVTMRKELGLTQIEEKEYVSGTWARTGAQIRFSRSWSGHRFTDKECEDLLAGKEIEISAVSKRTGERFDCVGSLEADTFKGKAFVGFKANFNKPTSDPAPRKVLGVKLTEDQRDKLRAGEKVKVTGMKSRRTGGTFDAYLRLGKKDDGSPDIKFSFKEDD